MENSLIYCLSGTAIALVTVVPAGYGLATGSFRGRELILTLTLIAMLMPSAALVLPIFLELNAARLIGSMFAVILPFSFFPFGVYLTYLYYATVLPRDLRDAARIDGCGDWAVFRRVADPAGEAASSRLSSFSASLPTGTTSSCRTSSSRTTGSSLWRSGCPTSFSRRAPRSPSRRSSRRLPS